MRKALLVGGVFLALVSLPATALAISQSHKYAASVYTWGPVSAPSHLTFDAVASSRSMFSITVDCRSGYHYRSTTFTTSLHKVVNLPASAVFCVGGILGLNPAGKVSVRIT